MNEAQATQWLYDHTGERVDMYYCPLLEYYEEQTWRKNEKPRLPFWILGQIMAKRKKVRLAKEQLDKKTETVYAVKSE